MLEMTNGNITVRDLKAILKNMDNNLIIITENVQDGINRHNDVVGYEDDAEDEYFVLKIDNQKA